MGRGNINVVDTLPVFLKIPKTAQGNTDQD